jgi:hypothetical protein
MKLCVLFLSILALVLFVSESGQAQKPTSRVEKQHHATTFIKSHLKQTEDRMLSALNAPFENEGLNGPLQTVRDLEQLFPDYPFEKLLVPLENILKNEQADPTSRMLAALAIDELHSDAGDSVIKNVAEKLENTEVKLLCKALLFNAKLE